jgi:hypothetical protein
MRPPLKVHGRAFFSAEIGVSAAFPALPELHSLNTIDTFACYGKSRGALTQINYV